MIYPGKDEAMQKNYVPLTVSIYSAFIFKIEQIWQNLIVRLIQELKFEHIKFTKQISLYSKSLVISET